MGAKRRSVVSSTIRLLVVQQLDRMWKYCLDLSIRSLLKIESSNRMSTMKVLNID